MYLDFYGFAKKPFELTPDPDFVYLGEKHREALALLKYGILEHKGFILLTGEAGTGKTTILQTFLKYLSPTTRTVFLSNPALTPEDFLYYVAFDLGLKVQIGKKGEFLIEFKKLLNECSANRTNIVIIIDEAQDLSPDLLEEVRLLSCMEAGPAKMLNIILTGQPELNRLLSSSRCRALLQRISIRYDLTPLSRAETRTYIRSRISASGGPPNLFHKSVANAVHKHSNGLPRLINSICDNILLLGYSQGKRNLTSKMVREASPENRSLDTRPGWKKVFLTAMALFLSFAMAIAVVLFPKNLSSFSKDASSYIRSAFTWCQDLLNASDEETASKPIHRRDSVLLASQTDQPLSKAPDPATPLQNKAPESAARSEHTDEGHRVQKTAHKTDQALLEEADARKIDNDTTGPYADSTNDVDRAPVRQIARVNEGDTLTTFALKAYGIANDNILELILENNPKIENPDFLVVDQTIVFPKLTDKEIPGRYSVHIASIDTMSEFSLACMHFRKSRLHILVSSADENGAFKLALGSFDSLDEARDYAESLLDRGVVDFANPVALPAVSE